MAKRFVFVGDENMGEIVAGKLVQAGWEEARGASEADLALSYFLHASLLEDAYFDADGLIKNMPADGLLIDLSATAPSFARELSAIAAVNDLRFIEAPLCVVDPAATDALETRENVVCYVAGEDRSIDDALDALTCFAGEVKKTGGAGTGQLAKSLHTVRQAAKVTGVIESYALMQQARYASLPADEKLVEVVDKDEVERQLAANIDEDDMVSGLPAEIFMADIVAAVSAADEMGLVLPQIEATMHLLELLIVIGGAELGPAAWTLLFSDEAASVAHGLDWSRAEGLFNEHMHDAEEFEEPDEDDYLDDFGYPGGFGEYSAN